MTQNDEAAELPQRQRKINFLAREVLLIESADRFEVFTSREDECPDAQTHGEVGRGENDQENPCPERHRTIECDTSTSTNAAILDRLQRGANMHRIDLRIRID